MDSYIFKIPKVEMVKIISDSRSMTNILKRLSCRRKTFVKYLEIHEMQVPFDWLLDKKSLRIYVKMAMRQCRHYTVENIMLALADIMPDSVQDLITYNVVEKTLKEILHPREQVRGGGGPPLRC